MYRQNVPTNNIILAAVSFCARCNDGIDGLRQIHPNDLTSGLNSEVRLMFASARLFETIADENLPSSRTI